MPLSTESINIVNNFSTELKKLIVFATNLGNNKDQIIKLERYRALALNSINYDPLTVMEVVGSKLFENKDVIQHGTFDLVITETVDKKYKNNIEDNKFVSSIFDTIKDVYGETTTDNKEYIMAHTNELLDIYIQYLISLK